ncbi:hypothetical protein MLGJGCBP_01402 [Rhodococcus sp. T7]|nr:hypothetical protein MLGJGCBP_09564 [Rhodococcus sp. T7]KAF0965435.1 hypothetical protein MLGJGCBP_01402 [Rhodococcus sp. T7]
MTASVAQRFKLIKQDLNEYGGADNGDDLKVLEDLARHVPLIGAMTTRNFVDVLELLRGGRVIEPTDANHGSVVERGLTKQAPFHRSRNSVADALLIELYATAVEGVDLAQEPHVFVTSNSEDFSQQGGDKRRPHPDIEATFAQDGSIYALGVDGLNDVLLMHFGPEIEELFAETEFVDEPRRLDAWTPGRLDAWTRSSMLRNSSLTGSGTTDLSNTNIGCRTPKIRWSSNGSLRSPVLAASTSKRPTQNRASSDPTRTSSLACSTANFQHCVGSLAANGTSSTRRTANQPLLHSHRRSDRKVLNAVELGTVLGTGMEVENGSLPWSLTWRYPRPLSRHCRLTGD